MKDRVIKGYIKREQGKVKACVIEIYEHGSRTGLLKNSRLAREAYVTMQDDDSHLFEFFLVKGR